MHLDPALFRDDAISDETRRFNTEKTAELTALPDSWSVPPAEIRKLRDKGLGAFPLPPRCPRATTITIDGPHGAIEIRQILPETGTPRGVYLHIHGGGWTFGAADYQDDRLEEITRTTGAAALSLDYRLAPEHPYPQGPDDCEAAALWLVRQSPFRDLPLVIGGESAGAHLSVVTLIRLRDKHELTPFAGAALTAGCYDLALTPSARNWGTEKLILTTRDITLFARSFLGEDCDATSADISPIRADLAGLPPALFSVGTRDALLDDSLFMAARWMAAGNGAEISVHPGGCHVFQAFPLEISRKSNAEIDAFINAAFDRAS
ncbi:acetyl esterase/lipase [Breoghania corrubedonensis]|uniref:Acetyl esterase/lipase n=1 Tax=Breoghania corrubedonensis TaxID=665038 RepID=A0A2T5VEB8_9HYPH|nr:alpha/beta hydrolase [Breoghania corrubedonensis]PTW62100.1 acetyl esterase/lipase [Breoghania corrubedonensis]